jgi:hypothetical protein
MYLKSNKYKNVKSRYKNIINKDNINPHIQPIRNNKIEDDYKIIKNTIIKSIDPSSLLLKKTKSTTNNIMSINNNNNNINKNKSTKLNINSRLFNKTKNTINSKYKTPDDLLKEKQNKELLIIEEKLKLFQIDQDILRSRSLTRFSYAAGVTNSNIKISTPSNRLLSPTKSITAKYNNEYDNKDNNNNNNKDNNIDKKKINRKINNNWNITSKKDTIFKFDALIHLRSSPML